jgi:anti-repressor protein
MNQLQTFNFSNQSVRIVIVDDDPWWVLADVCGVLGIGNPSMVDFDRDEVRTLRITEGGPERRIINESGLYSMIMRSRKPEARAFRKWVTSEVLPQIRRTGSYGIQQLSRMEILQLALKAEQELQDANAKLIEQKPLVSLAENCIQANNVLTMQQAGDILGMGRTSFFEALRKAKIIQPKPKNIPYREFIDRGYFEVKVTPKAIGGQVVNFTQTYVTGKGMEWLNSKDIKMNTCQTQDK